MCHRPGSGCATSSCSPAVACLAQLLTQCSKGLNGLIDCRRGCPKDAPTSSHGERRARGCTVSNRTFGACQRPWHSGPGTAAQRAHHPFACDHRLTLTGPRHSSSTLPVPSPFISFSPAHCSRPRSRVPIGLEAPKGNQRRQQSGVESGSDLRQQCS